jgi:hypothetical protein
MGVITMIKIENVDVYGWEAAIRGMRNPKNSWDKSDTVLALQSNSEKKRFEIAVEIGDNDLKLMKNLANAGDDHGKFLRMITVTADVVAPLYWWKEADTYRMGVEKNSCSTMHKIHDKEFTMDDFSHEHNLYWGNLEHTIDALNHAREQYLLTKDKKYWYSMIQLLPSSYNQRRTCMFSYAALRNIYHARRFHKLDEWRTFCDFIRTLPYSELITGEASDDV